MPRKRTELRFLKFLGSQTGQLVRIAAGVALIVAGLLPFMGPKFREETAARRHPG